MNPGSLERVAHAYFDAKHFLIASGWSQEIDAAYDRIGRDITEPGFLSEGAWVVLTCGMRERVVAERFSEISAAFFGWQSAELIVRRRSSCRGSAIAVFNHPAKVDAILAMADAVSREGILGIVSAMGSEPTAYLQRFSFLGPVTAHHMAKNLGFDTAKPDRHLSRIAASFGWSDAVGFCRVLGDCVGDPAAVVDTVFWRYATLVRDYLDRLTARSG